MLYSRLSVAIALSLSLHLLLLALLLLQPAPAPAKTTVKAAPLTVQIINRPKPKTPAQAPTPATSNPKNTKAAASNSGTTTAANRKAKHKTEAAPGKNPAAPKHLNTTKTATAFTAPTLKTAQKQNTQQAKPQPGTAEAATVKPGLADRILATVATRQQQQATELSSAEVQALQQKTVPDKASSLVRSGPKPSYAADNVLEVLNNGSFIEKIGDYCYQAKAGADIRRDIFSMKPVTCGDDANEVLYHSIMDKVGKNRR